MSVAAPESPEPRPPQVPSPAPCRSCGRTIASEDAYCRYCGKRQSPAGGWLYHPITLVLLAFLVIGPLAIPLVVRSPYLSRTEKIILNISITIYTILLLYVTYVLAVQLVRESSDLLNLMNL